MRYDNGASTPNAKHGRDGRRDRRDGSVVQTTHNSQLTTRGSVGLVTTAKGGDVLQRLH
jgi:hypothetical protein